MKLGCEPVTNGELLTNVSPPSGPEDLHLVVLFAKEGLGLTTQSGNVAPKCGGDGQPSLGPGLTLPRTPEGDQDWKGLKTCTLKLRSIAQLVGKDATVTLSAPSDTPHSDVIRAIEVLRNKQDGPRFTQFAMDVPPASSASAAASASAAPSSIMR